MTYIRPLPQSAGTATLHTTHYALRAFDASQCRHILDVGCGDCFFEAHAPGRFVGIDVEPTRLVRGAARGVRGLVAGRAEALPFRDEIFDGILAMDVLEHLHLEQAFQFLGEAQRVLQRGGIFVVMTFQATQSFWDKPDHVRPYSNKWVRRVLTHEVGGFAVIGEYRFSAGIPGFGRLGLERLAHGLAHWTGLRHDHGMIVLRKQ
jgi:ubiquinone/menaquinone biosynthesis C-methylase UbiE